MPEDRFAEQTYQTPIQEALTRIVNDDRTHVQDVLEASCVVTKWVVLVEVIDVTGEKYLTGYRGPTSNSIPVWDVKGMLKYGMDEMDFLDDDNDDEEGD